MNTLGARGVLLFWAVILFVAIAALAAWIAMVSGTVVSLPSAVSGEGTATATGSTAIETEAAGGATTPPPPQPLWLKRAVPAPDAAGRPIIAIVIDDLGLDRARSSRAIALPGPLTLAWLAYADDLAAQTTAATNAGHELFLHLPMEPLDSSNDPGPNALLVGMSSREIRRIVRVGLDRVPSIVGVNNHMGSRFTADRAGMAVVLTTVKEADLVFLDSRTTGDSVAGPLAALFGMPFAARDVFLDDDRDTASVAQRLADVERVAREQGSAIAIGHPADVTLDALEAWLPSLSERGFVLVPVSAVVQARQPAPVAAP